MTSINILVILGLLSLSSIIKAVPVIDSPDKGEQKRSIASGACLDSLLVMGFTSGLVDADSNDQYSVKMKVINEDTATSHLPNRPGVEYLKHKGDLWTISFADDFSFTSSCVKKSDIEFIKIKASGNDNWNIETIVTFVKSGNNYELATSDFEVDRWIDGSPSAPPLQDRFELNLIL